MLAMAMRPKSLPKKPRKLTYPVDAQTVFAAILKCSRALHRLKDLAKLLPKAAKWDLKGDQTDLTADPESICDALVQLEVEGLIEVWPDSPAGPVIILSSLSAKQANLELYGKVPAWRPIKGRQRSERIKKREKLKDEVEAGIYIEEVADPDTRHPSETLEDARRPHVLLGERLTWNGPEQMEGRHYTTFSRCLINCVGCNDKALPPGHYCLVCDGRPKGKTPKARVNKPVRPATAKTRRESRAAAKQAAS